MAALEITPRDAAAPYRTYRQKQKTQTFEKPMSHLTIRTEHELKPETLQALEPTRMGGKLAPVYLEIANSESALQAYLQMEEALRASGLSLQELEAIKLLVSQHNQCEYCLSVHTMKARAAGLSAQQQTAIRKSEPLGEARLDAIVSVATHLLKTRRALSPQQISALRSVGLDDRQMVDIALAISTITFTNLFNHFNDSKAPFAPAPPID